jgi:hypothetical protein
MSFIVECAGGAEKIVVGVSHHSGASGSRPHVRKVRPDDDAFPPI